MAYLYNAGGLIVSIRFINYLTAPLISYFEATIGLSCSSWCPKEDFSGSNSRQDMSEKALAVKSRESRRYGYRPRKQSFSLFLCIQKQREMSSPAPLEPSYDKGGWIEEELSLAASPQKNHLIQ